jgi:hypothetical protein
LTKLFINCGNSKEDVLKIIQENQHISIPSNISLEQLKAEVKNCLNAELSKGRKTSTPVIWYLLIHFNEDINLLDSFLNRENPNFHNIINISRR